jgi:hypothetical protein
MKPEDPADFTTTVQTAFLPISESLWNVLKDDGDSDHQYVHPWQRRRLAQMLVTSVGLWYCLLELGGLNLRARIDRSSHFCSLYADHMVMYHLCDSIWTWNRLEESRLHDEYDIDIARALVRFLDLAIALEYGADIFKRAREATGNILASFPELWETMIDEAGYCACSDGLMDTLQGARSDADRYLREGR